MHVYSVVSSSFAALWTVACQGPLTVEFSRQEYLSGLLYPPPGDLLNPGIEPRSPTLQVDSLLAELPGKPILYVCMYVYMSEKAIAPHSSTLAWKIPWTEEPGGLQSMGSLRVGHD